MVTGKVIRKLFILFFCLFDAVFISSVSSIRNVNEAHTILEDKNEINNKLTTKDSKSLGSNEREIKKVNSLADTTEFSSIELMDYGKLLSRNKPATQSSLHLMYTADKAVDGNKDTALIKGGSCTHTRISSDYPWFRIDLEKNYYIDRVEVLNRGDCCPHRLNHFNVAVTQAIYNDPNNIPPRNRCGEEYTKMGGLSELIPIQCNNKWGRYVTVYINRTNAILSLCEVEVFEGVEPIKANGNLKININVD